MNNICLKAHTSGTEDMPTLLIPKNLCVWTADIYLIETLIPLAFKISKRAPHSFTSFTFYSMNI